MTDYKSRLGGLADKLKTAQPAPPIQEVHPVKVESVESAEECRFNNWIPKKLKRKLKKYALENEMSLKEINIKALEQFICSSEERTATAVNK